MTYVFNIFHICPNRIEYAIKFVEKRSPLGSIDEKLSRICQKAVKLEKTVFSKRGKHIKMNATKQAT